MTEPSGTVWDEYSGSWVVASPVDQYDIDDPIVTPDVSIASRADLAGFVEDYGSSDNFMPAAPANDIEASIEIELQQSAKGDPGNSKPSWAEYLNKHATISPRDLVLGGWKEDYKNQLQDTLDPEIKTGVPLAIPSAAKKASLSETIIHRANETAAVFSELTSPSGAIYGKLAGIATPTGINTGLIVAGVAGLVLLILIIK